MNKITMKENIALHVVAIFVILVCFLINGITAAFSPNDIRNFLGSRTPYRFKSNKNDTTIKYPNCKDTKIWMIIRHGTRYPGPRDIFAANKTLDSLKLKILLNHNQGKGKLTKDELHNLKNWSNSLNMDEERFLALEGQDEMVLMAERMQNRFPNAINNNYSKNTFLFRYTATQRAQQSAQYFVKGLFDTNDSRNVVYAPAAKVDPVLRFYKHCDKWQRQVKRNPETYKEQNLYGISDEMNKTLESVSERLGFHNVLSLDEVNIMYKICGYETAWRKHHISPWCYAFDENTIQVLEYYHDLKHYWIDGYGHDLTYRQACISIKHMFEHFSDDEKELRAMFLFAHSGTVLKILTHLGLYKPDVPLMGDALVKDRPWKTSDIDCFATNLAFVLFKCEDGDHVLTLHQERIVKLPMCKKELCPLKYLKEYFKESIYNCNYTDMCKL